MRASYERLGMQGAWHRFAAGGITKSSSKFEQQLRDIETGAVSLNLSPDAVHLAAEIAAFEPSLSDDERIGLILLIVSSMAALEEGSTRFPVAGPQSVDPMRRQLGPLCGESFGENGVEKMRDAIEQLLISNSAGGVIGTNPNDYKPLIYLSPFIYHQRVLTAEIALARRLAGLSSRPSIEFDETRVHDLLHGGSANLSEEQRAAVEFAATAPLTIISGGPGTGKTSIVLAILRVLVRAGMDPAQIALAAPTGKAAYRIGESIRENLPRDCEDFEALRNCRPPTTVHRLLGYSPTRRRFHYHRNNPLVARVVIVDEGSMIDLELMSHLLDAMRPDARLVILGDADQLPSVSAGAIFRDLVPTSTRENDALARNCVHLTRSYRTNTEEAGGSAIFRLANAINIGDADPFASAGGEVDAIVARRDSAGQLRFVGAEWLPEETASAAFLERWYAERVRTPEAAGLANRVFTAAESGFPATECGSLRQIFENLASARILSVTRVFDSGSERFNSLMHRRAAHEKGAPPDRDRFMVGEPVMMLRNDYVRMLFNGDQGVVLRVRHPGNEAATMAVFPRDNNFVAFEIGALKEQLELCYALTVHKAQGSEYDSVAVIMPNQALPILTREILYTAVSRARKSVIIVGSKDVIQAGLAHRIERFSGVREQLAQSLTEPQRG